MIRVAIETATSRGGVAVGRSDSVLAEVTLGVQTRHAEMAVPALDAAFRLAGVARRDVGAVVVGSGPGSFTGVRVAGATAKGLAAALDVPLLAFSSLLALVAGVPLAGDGVNRPVCGLFDARRGEVYAGCWRVGPSSLEPVLEPRVGPIEGVIEAATAATAATGAAGATGATPLFVGDGALRYRDALAAAGAAHSTHPVWPRASTLLWLAEHHPSVGAVDDVGAWEPLYVRASSAERGR